MRLVHEPRLARRAAAGAALVLALALASGPAAAEPGSAGPFGLGLVLGQPTGITAQWYRRAPGFGNAIEAALGLDVFSDRDFYLHVTWKFYLAQLSHGRDIDVPVYVGIGGFLFDRGNDELNNLDLGARAPFGIALEFHRAPIEIFLEIALYAIVVSDNDHDPIDLGGSLGFRYYF